MKVILRADVQGIGKKNEVKEVKDGFARNFLLPHKLAEQATLESLKKLQEFTTLKEEEDKELRAHLERVARDMKDKFVEFYLKVGEDGSVFGSVSKDQILRAIREHFSKHDRIDVHLDHPIKELGEHLVTVDFKKGIEAKLKVVIKPEKQHGKNNKTE